MKHNEAILAARAFSLLRASTKGWRLDTTGYWSYPAFLNLGKSKMAWLCLILGIVPLPAKKRTALFRPKAVVISKAGYPEVLRYENFRFSHDPFPSLSWDKPVAMFPHKSVAQLTYKQLERKEAELFASYPEAQKEFAEVGKLPDAFMESYVDLIHPVFLPYLKHLAPAFFIALGVVKTR